MIRKLFACILLLSFAILPAFGIGIRHGSQAGNLVFNDARYFNVVGDTVTGVSTFEDAIFIDGDLVVGGSITASTTETEIEISGDINLKGNNILNVNTITGTDNHWYCWWNRFRKNNPCRPNRKLFWRRCCLDRARLLLQRPFGSLF